MSAQEHAVLLAKSLHIYLSNAAEIQAVLGQNPRLYDYAPEDPIYPYLSYGQMRSENIGGDDCALYEHLMSLHIWSQYGGRAEILRLLSAFSIALDGGQFPLTGAHLVSARILYSDHFRTPDGRTLHGVLRISFKTQETE